MEIHDGVNALDRHSDYFAWRAREQLQWAYRTYHANIAMIDAEVGRTLDAEVGRTLDALDASEDS